MEKLIILKIFDMNILYHYFSNVHIVFNAKYTGKLYLSSQFKHCYIVLLFTQVMLVIVSCGIWYL